VVVVVAPVADEDPVDDEDVGVFGVIVLDGVLVVLLWLQFLW